MQPLIVDGHLDLAMNAVHWNRDLTRPLESIRSRDVDLDEKPDRGNGVVCFEEMRRGGIGLCIATQIGHSVSEITPLPGWHSPEIAWAQTQAQLAWYRVMEEQRVLRQITDQASLDEHLKEWAADPENAPIGYVLSLEGADSMLTLDYVERAYGYGLRAIGPAHYGPGRYSPGTGAEGGLEPAGKDLLRLMVDLGIALDVTHLTDEAFWQALEIHTGTVWASHNNCRALVDAQRQFSDDQLNALIQRDAVIGVAMDAWMLIPDWVRGQTTPDETGVSLNHVVDHIDHICQLAGNADHCAIGSDLDGGYGTEQCPTDVRSIADLRRIDEILADRGYSAEDREGIMHGNWIRTLRRAWSTV